MEKFQYDSLLHIYQTNQENVEHIKKQYLSLLSQLKPSLMVSTEEFINTIHEISRIGDIIICYYYNKEQSNLIFCGSGTVLYEPKIIHGCKKVGHIEDIVVHSEYRSHGIASTILQLMIDKAKQSNCYKLILDCKPELVHFYEKNGFRNYGIQMGLYF